MYINVINTLNINPAHKGMDSTTVLVKASTADDIVPSSTVQDNGSGECISFFFVQDFSTCYYMYAFMDIYFKYSDVCIILLISLL